MSYLFSKTLSPELYDLNVYYEKDFYTLYSNYGEFLQEGIDTLNYFLDYNKSNVIFDPIKSKANIFEELDQGGLDSYDEIQFKVFWYETFISSMKEVQELFEKKLGDKVKFFKEISDNIGQLRNVEFLPDDNILPIFDLDFNLSSDKIEDQLIPLNVHTTVVNKLRPETQKMILQMSLFTNSVYRHNMYQLADGVSTSKEAHGDNLVSDYFHYERLYNIAKEDLEADLTKHFQEVYDLILWYENYNPQSINSNRQDIYKTNYSLEVQDVVRSVDFLKQEITTFQNLKSFINHLGVSSE
jgi:hypothetical protein|tara:strand:+ start:1110 stop:2003 length:894 start_codon:yes stop_codon:yes gene_type:complete